MRKKVNVGETIGVKRKLDPLGRIVIPKEFRDTINLKEGEQVEMFLVSNGLFIKTREE